MVQLVGATTPKMSQVKFSVQEEEVGQDEKANCLSNIHVAIHVHHQCAWTFSANCLPVHFLKHCTHSKLLSFALFHPSGFKENPGFFSSEPDQLSFSDLKFCVCSTSSM
jgi:hypothetical protein